MTEGETRAGFDLPASSRRKRGKAICVAISQPRRRRVFLVVDARDAEPSGWEARVEIIGFEALRPLLRRRRPAATVRSAA